ncbi:MAG: hypothetical protein IT257_06870 [Chitinophagaceae bacterium]|nr:hypothetical protein [Chitinophagaceae bacterium]
MAAKKTIWKKGRGKLGVLSPLLGTYVAVSESPVGAVKCTRTFTEILAGKYIELKAIWEIGAAKFEEMAIFGAFEGELSFWSFTSDGKKSSGKISEAADVHPEAICFEATMPAGIARMIYWPSENGAFCWAVESKVKNGWNRFVMHTYHKSLTASHG